MSEDQSLIHQPGGDAAAGNLIEQLNAYSGPAEGFLQHLLAVQCETTPAEAGAVVRPEEQAVQVLAIHPPHEEGQQPEWLRVCIGPSGRVVATGKAEIVPLVEPHQLYGQPAKRCAVIVPLRRGPQGMAAAFVLPMQDGRVMLAKRERLELTAALLSVYEMRLATERRSHDVNRLRSAMEMLSVVNEQPRFKGAAMAFCNELAARWQCERVGFGVLKGRYVHLKALSHTEKFSRKMKLVQDIESTMEECIDQDVEVVVPTPPEATCISRAATELSRGHGLAAVVSLPLRQGGEPVGVVTAERAYDEPFAVEDVESLRLACDLATPRLMNLHKHDRWFGARAAGAVGDGLGVLVGRKHTWIKLAAVGVLAAAMFLVAAEGDYEAKAPFVLEAVELRVIPAPFDGYIADVRKEPGDPVKRGELLATLHTAELKEQLNAKLAEHQTYRKEADAARNEGKTVEAQIADAKADKVAAEINLLEDRMSKAEIRVPGKDQPGGESAGKLSDEITSKVAERKRHRFKADAFRREGKSLDADLAEAKAALAAAEIRHLEVRLSEATTRAPTEGRPGEATTSDRLWTVVSGDLKKKIGAPVETGDPLFEVAPVAALRAVLSVPEDMIADVREADAKAAARGERAEGELATAARPDVHLRFRLERIHPVAEVVNQKNVFKVRVALLDVADPKATAALAIGTEGAARIHIGRRRYAWIWSRRLVNWVRMKLWF